MGVQRRAEEAIGSPGAGDWAPWPEYWELNSGPLQEQCVVLTTTLSCLSSLQWLQMVKLYWWAFCSLYFWDENRLVTQTGYFSFLKASLKIWALIVPPCSLSLTCPILTSFSLLSTADLFQLVPWFRIGQQKALSSSHSLFSTQQANQRHPWSPFWNNWFYIANRSHRGYRRGGIVGVLIPIMGENAFWHALRFDRGTEVMGCIYFKMVFIRLAYRIWPEKSNMAVFTPKRLRTQQFSAQYGWVPKQSQFVPKV